MNLPAFVKRWGPTILLALAIGTPVGWFLSWSIPIGLFLLGGERRVAAIETDIAGIKRRQKRDCEVQLAGLWWMTATSRIKGEVEPPGAQKIIDEGCDDDGVPRASVFEAAPSLFFDSAYASPRLEVPLPPRQEGKP